jgi:competence protein ComEC
MQARAVAPRFLAVLLLVLGVSWLASADLPDGKLTIVHMDVGQAAATLILGPPNADGKRVSVLVDAGGYKIQSTKDGAPIVADILAEYGVTEVDYLVVTHYDCDHIGGIVQNKTGFRAGCDGTPGTADDVGVLTFVDRGPDCEKTSTAFNDYTALVQPCEEQDADCERLSIYGRDGLKEVAEIPLGEGASAPKLRFIAASGWALTETGDTVEVEDVNTENENSLCFLLSYGSFDYLLGGDITGQPSKHASKDENAAVEGAVGQYVADCGRRVDVLNVNHHGSDTASEESFLRLIRPQVAVISAGPVKSYGHPNLGALRRLAARKVRIYQTERGATEEPIPSAVKSRQVIANGHVIVTTDGQRFQVWVPRAKRAGSYRRASSRTARR